MGGIPSKPDPTKSMQVIGAGFPRTGTNSVQLALELLLDGPVHHGGTHILAGSPGELFPCLNLQLEVNHH